MGKSKLRGEQPRLTERQKKLVRDNMGLVAVHLKRHVANLAVPQRDREYDDLFQEGCLGLMRSAARWDPAGGIPFAAYALPRIHNAISMALRCKFATIYVPPRRADRRRAGDTAAHPGDRDRPRTRTISDVQWKTLADAPVVPAPNDRSETVGDRIREKYEQTVRRAAFRLKQQRSARGDRDELMRLIVHERLLVPNAESQRSLRQIARDTASSYARVAQCAARLTGAIQRMLEHDPEFTELLAWARRHPDGFAARVDDDIERAVARVAADECVRRFEHGCETERASVLYAVARHAHADLPRLVRRAVNSMSRVDRHGLLNEAIDWHEPRQSAARARHAPDRGQRGLVSEDRPGR